MMPNLAREAAFNLRTIWQAHDEKNQLKGKIAASELYRNLGAETGVHLINNAGYLTINAFFLADDAERFMGEDDSLEDFFYDQAKRYLVKAREMIGFETRSPYYTVRWWKDFRHKDKTAAMENLINEHREQLSHLSREELQPYMEKCIPLLVKAAEVHRTHDWKAVEDILEQYFEIYLEAWQKRK